MALSAILNEMQREGLRINVDHTDLSFLDLRCLNLKGMTAVEAEFVCSNLSGAQIAHADLTKTNMIEANLSNTDLTGSSLRGAFLRQAKMANSTLRYVDFTDAFFDKTYISLEDTDVTDLTGVITEDASFKKFLNKFKKYFSSELTVSGKVYLSSVQKPQSGSKHWTCQRCD
jgi:uncharacterized protein YjbI with pentapeptide repeats